MILPPIFLRSHSYYDCMLALSVNFQVDLVLPSQTRRLSMPLGTFTFTVLESADLRR